MSSPKITTPVVEPHKPVSPTTPTDPKTMTNPGAEPGFTLAIQGPSGPVLITAGSFGSMPVASAAADGGQTFDLGTLAPAEFDLKSIDLGAVAKLLDGLAMLARKDYGKGVLTILEAIKSFRDRPVIGSAP